MSSEIRKRQCDSISVWKNGWYELCIGDTSKVMTPNFSVSIERRNCTFWYLSELYIGYEEYSDESNMFEERKECGILDYVGNVITPLDNEVNFNFAEYLGDGFVKIQYRVKRKSDIACVYSCWAYGIIDQRGHLVYDGRKDDVVRNIKYMGNGLFRLQYCDGINFINGQGHKLLCRNYEITHVLENGYIHFMDSYDRNDHDRLRGGLANYNGDVLVEPVYGIMSVTMNGAKRISSDFVQWHKRLYDGNIIVLGTNNDKIRLPRKYCQGSDFKDGICIVKDMTGKIGVVNERCEEIIEPKYDEVILLSNKTIEVVEGKFRGTFDLQGNAILPVIFESIIYFRSNRIKVIWDSNNAKEWGKGKFTPGPLKDISKDTSAEKSLRKKSCLCDNVGNVLCDIISVCGPNREKLPWNKYLRCETNRRIVDRIVGGETSRVVRSKSKGVIDIDGNIVVEPNFEEVNFSDKDRYAELMKDNIYGIADLETGKIRMYNDLSIKKMFRFDKEARFVYIDDENYHGESLSSWTGKKGLLGMNGVIIPSGLYKSFRRIPETDLFEVCDDTGNNGILGHDGKIKLAVKYSYISDFTDKGVATVCEDRTCSWGKWGLIDRNCNFIVECKYDKEPVYDLNENAFVIYRNRVDKIILFKCVD